MKRGDTVIIGKNHWEWFPEYGWVDMVEDDPTFGHEETLLNHVFELEAELQKVAEWFVPDGENLLLDHGGGWLGHVDYPMLAHLVDLHVFGDGLDNTPPIEHTLDPLE